LLRAAQSDSLQSAQWPAERTPVIGSNSPVGRLRSGSLARRSIGIA
jgi:hypothetical protein